MTKHSPAPWEIGDEYCNVRDEIVDADGCTIAVVWTRRPTNPYATVRLQFKDVETFKGNLRLMRAAPELLEALQALLDWGRDHTSPTDANSPHDLLVAAHSAIQKATQE